MKPRHKLAQTLLSDGKVMALFEQDGEYSINYAGQELMHSRLRASEVLLGKIGVANLRAQASSRVMIGGLGLGLTLKSVLENTGRGTAIEVLELIPAVVDWNRTFLAPLNGSALEALNVVMITGDAVDQIRGSQPKTFDAILLDLDNGPIAMVTEGNGRLYSATGLRAVRAALKVGGRAVFWSARPDAGFATRLAQAKFRVSAVPAKTHDNAKRAAYMLYVAEKM